MRKIPSYLENPIDNAMIAAAHPTSTVLKKLHMTPNGITTISLVFGLLAVVFLAIGRVWLAVISYGLSYFFDNVDGYYARRYKMCSKGGDLYDHLKDWIVFVLFISVFIMRNRKKLNRKQWAVVAGIIVFFSILVWIQMNAQEAFHGIKTKDQAVKTMRITRYFGCGSYILVLMIIVLIVELK
jgi:phosphatidylserine synthase